MLLRRAILLFAALAVLSAPVAAWAKPGAHGSKQGDNNDGTLSVLRGKGTVDLQAQGAVVGLVKKGKVKVKIYKSKHKKGTGHGGQVLIRMKGKGTIRHKADGTIIYNGRNIHIRIVDKKFRVQIDGVGVHLSAIAEGTCALQAAPNVDPGVFSLNGGPLQALPQNQTTYQLST